MPVVITSKQHNFRRCGVAHPKEPTEYPGDRFSEEELAILGTEPMLTVSFVSGDGEIARGPAPEKMTVRQLKTLLDKLEVEYPDKAVKADLVALVEEHTAEPPEE